MSYILPACNVSFRADLDPLSAVFVRQVSPESLSGSVTRLEAMTDDVSRSSSSGSGSRLSAMMKLQRMSTYRWRVDA